MYAKASRWRNAKVKKVSQSVESAKSKRGPQCSCIEAVSRIMDMLDQSRKMLVLNIVPPGQLITY